MGGFRLILNLKGLNACLLIEKFSMETLASILLDLQQSNMWMGVSGPKGRLASHSHLISSHAVLWYSHWGILEDPSVFTNGESFRFSWLPPPHTHTHTHALHHVIGPSGGPSSIQYWVYVRPLWFGWSTLGFLPPSQTLITDASSNPRQKKLCKDNLDMESVRVSPSRQSSAGFGSFQRASVLPAEPSARSPPCSDRQYHRSFLSEQDWRDKVPLAQMVSRGDHSMVPGQVHHASGHSPMRSRQCRSWQIVLSSVILAGQPG